MGGGGWDHWDRETRNEENAKSYYDNHKCSLQSFSDEQLKAELEKRRRLRAKELETKEKNKPIKNKIEQLENEIKDLKRKLK